jgi:hypothetical protein
MNREQARSVEGKIRLWVLEQERDRQIERQLIGSDHRGRGPVRLSGGARDGRRARH